MGDDIIAIATADAIGQQLLADALKEIVALREEVAALRQQTTDLREVQASLLERLDNLEDIVDTVTGPLDF